MIYRILRFVNYPLTAINFHYIEKRTTFVISNLIINRKKLKKMKKFVALFAFILFVTAAAFAQPKAQFELKKLDYGTIDKGSEPLRIFKFKNVGTEPLIIKNAKGSCGCTVPKSPKDPIMPGEEANLEVRYDTKRVGKFTKTVTLTTNDPTNPKTVLTIHGEVKPVKAKKTLPQKKSALGN